MAHDGEVGCTTIEYTMVVLYSDWLCLLWHGINCDIFKTQKNDYSPTSGTNEASQMVGISTNINPFTLHKQMTKNAFCAKTFLEIVRTKILVVLHKESHIWQVFATHWWNKNRIKLSKWIYAQVHILHKRRRPILIRNLKTLHNNWAN